MRRSAWFIAGCSIALLKIATIMATLMLLRSMPEKSSIIGNTKLNTESSKLRSLMEVKPMSLAQLREYYLEKALLKM